MEMSGPQWNAIVDFVNVNLFHETLDATMERPDMKVEVSIGTEGFTIEVTPTVEDE